MKGDAAINKLVGEPKARSGGGGSGSGLSSGGPYVPIKEINKRFKKIRSGMQPASLKSVRKRLLKMKPAKLSLALNVKGLGSGRQQPASRRAGASARILGAARMRAA
jgi:hypothetical protein